MNNSTPEIVYLTLSRNSPLYNQFCGNHELKDLKPVIELGYAARLDECGSWYCVVMREGDDNYYARDEDNNVLAFASSFESLYGQIREYERLAWKVVRCVVA